MRERTGVYAMSIKRSGTRSVVAAIACLSAAFLAGCSGRDNLPPVFGAVFGVTGAPVRPFTEGRLTETVVEPNSRLVGSAASVPGQCIWQDEAGQRFRAACPEGSDGLKPRT